MFVRRCVQGLLLLCLTNALVGCAYPSLISIEITPTTETFIGAGGGHAQFTAIGTYQQGDHLATKQDITNVVTWSSNTTAVATMSATGVVTGVGYGSADITASRMGYTGLIIGHAQAIVCHPDPSNPDKCAS